MVIVVILPHTESRTNDHRELAPHFILGFEIRRKTSSVEPLSEVKWLLMRTKLNLSEHLWSLGS